MMGRGRPNMIRSDRRALTPLMTPVSRVAIVHSSMTVSVITPWPGQSRKVGLIARTYHKAEMANVPKHQKRNHLCTVKSLM